MQASLTYKDLLLSAPLALTSTELLRAAATMRTSDTALFPHRYRLQERRSIAQQRSILFPPIKIGVNPNLPNPKP